MLAVTATGPIVKMAATFCRVRLPDGRPGYQVIVAGPTRSVQAGPVTLVIEHDLDALTQADLIVVPGRGDPLIPSPPAVVSALQVAAAQGAQIASICVGAFTLAEAGLLDGRPATTHWLAAAELARKFPAVLLDPDVLYIDDGDQLPLRVPLAAWSCACTWCSATTA